MNKKSRFLSVGIAGALLMSLGSGAALAVESTPSAFENPSTTVTSPSPNTGTVTPISETQAKELRAQLEARIKSEYAYWSAQKEKSEADTRDKNNSFAEERKAVEATFAKEVSDLNQRRVSLDTKLKEQNANFAKAKAEAYTKAEALRKGAETKIKQLDERLANAQKVYEYEKRKATNDATRRAAEVKLNTVKNQVQAEKAAVLKNLERDRAALIATLTAALKNQEQAQLNYQKGIQEINALVNKAYAKKTTELRSIAEKQAAFGKAKQLESEALQKKLTEAKKRWEAERAALEAKIKAGTLSTVK